MYKNFLGKSLAIFCMFLLLSVSLAVGTSASASEVLSSVNLEIITEWFSDTFLNFLIH